MNSYCNNCGKNGHLFHQCKSAIISYGVISFRENPTKNNTREYLLIRRKDTLGFVDFMRGKYSIYNKEYILNMIKQMTNDEKLRLITDPFSKLWEDLWGTSISSKSLESSRVVDQYKTEEYVSRNKFDSLRLGIYTKIDCYTLEELVRSTMPIWTEAEWGFPKGRRNYQERDYDCAVREFCEETGYSLNKLVPLKNIQPFEEIFTGSNYKSYKHKYYVTYMKYEDTLSHRKIQASEVSESRWMSVELCYDAIRSYNVEKKRLLSAVERLLSENYLSQIGGI
jgi:8-oxo-dGTP pyrophosphatase MutT (NUDIX family)